MGRAAEIERNGNRAGIEEWKRNEKGKGSFEAAGVGAGLLQPQRGGADYARELQRTQNNKDSAEELETVKSNYTESTKTIESLTTEIEGLKEFQNKEVKAKKEAVIASYSEQLDEEALKPFNEKIDEYSIEDLDKELAYTLVKAKPALFSENQTGFVPKDNGNEGGIEAILSKYKK